jgi:hypothetical protein
VTRIKPVIEEIVEKSEDSTEDKEPKTEPPSVPQSETSEGQGKGNFKLIFFTALITALITGALAGGIYVYLTGVGSLPEVKRERGSTEITVSSPEPTATPEASSSAQVDLTKYKVNVLNGAGISGVAGKVQKLLQDAGFEKVTTGNAKTFDFEETVIQTKEDVSKVVIDKIEEALSTDYSTTASETLPTTSTYDIVVTVGSK